MRPDPPARVRAGAGGLPPEAWLLALSALPEIGPRRLAALLEIGSPEQAFGLLASADGAALAVLDGAAVGPEVSQAARRLDVGAMWRAQLRAGIGVIGRRSPAYPATLADDPDPPEVLCTRGDPRVLALPAVAVVGTRRCTRYGHDLARELGALLAAAGFCVVSGLALGIDAAAHEGALSVGGAPPVGVVACGLDVTYPRRNRSLWERVAETGVVVSEYPLGTRPTRWRFPARNRIIAALAPVLVVVESHEHGGSLHTVREALVRDRLVMAVPGPIRSAASMGTNRLIADGAVPVCELVDVLLAAGWSGQVSVAAVHPASADGADGAASPLLDVLCWQPLTPDEIIDRSGMEVTACLAEMTRLEAEGHLVRRGPYLERCTTGGTVHG